MSINCAEHELVSGINRVFCHRNRIKVVADEGSTKSTSSSCAAIIEVAEGRSLSVILTARTEMQHVWETPGKPVVKKHLTDGDKCSLTSQDKLKFGNGIVCVFHDYTLDTGFGHGKEAAKTKTLAVLKEEECPEICAADGRRRGNGSRNTTVNIASKQTTASEDEVEKDGDGGDPVLMQTAPKAKTPRQAKVPQGCGVDPCAGSDACGGVFESRASLPGGGKRTASPRRCGGVSSFATTDDGGEGKSGDNSSDIAKEDGDTQDNSKDGRYIMDRVDASCWGGDLATALSGKNSTQASSKAMAAPACRSGENLLVGKVSGVASKGNQQRRRAPPRRCSKSVGETVLAYETSVTTDMASMDDDVSPRNENEMTVDSEKDGEPSGTASKGHQQRRRGRPLGNNNGAGEMTAGSALPAAAGKSTTTTADDTHGTAGNRRAVVNDTGGETCSLGSNAHKKWGRGRRRRDGKVAGGTAVESPAIAAADAATTATDGARRRAENEMAGDSEKDSEPSGTASKGHQQRQYGHSLFDSRDVRETTIESVPPAAAGISAATTAEHAHGIAGNEMSAGNDTGGETSSLTSNGHQKRGRGRRRRDGKGTGGTALESAAIAAADTTTTAADDIRHAAGSPMPAVNETIVRDDNPCPGGTGASAGAGAGDCGVPDTSKTWVCSKCTLINDALDVRCAVCSEYRPPDKRSLRSKSCTPTRFSGTQSRQRSASRLLLSSPASAQSQQERRREVDTSTASRVAHGRGGAKVSGRGCGSGSRDSIGMTTKGRDSVLKLSDTESQDEKRSKPPTIANAGTPSDLPTPTAQIQKTLKFTAKDNGVGAPVRAERVDDLTPNEILSSPGRSRNIQNGDGKAFPDNDSGGSSSTMVEYAITTCLSAIRGKDLDRREGNTARNGPVENTTCFATSAAAPAVAAAAAAAATAATTAKHSDTGLRPSLGDALSGQVVDEVQATGPCSEHNSEVDDTGPEYDDKEVKAAQRWCAWAEAKDDITSPVEANPEEEETLKNQFGLEPYDAVALGSAFPLRQDDTKEECDGSKTPTKKTKERKRGANKRNSTGAQICDKCDNNFTNPDTGVSSQGPAVVSSRCQEKGGVVQSAAIEGKRRRVDGGDSAAGQVRQENGFGAVAERDEEETETDGTISDE